eukprot:scaffold1617_cov252-Pinguiococcus_pyrenoidosus.AAC.9
MDPSKTACSPHDTKRNITNFVLEGTQPSKQSKAVKLTFQVSRIPVRFQGIRMFYTAYIYNMFCLQSIELAEIRVQCNHERSEARTDFPVSIST